MKIAVFKPTNIRNNNAFATGQHIIFEALNKLDDYEFTYFIDDEYTNFNGINTKYLKIDSIKYFLLRIIRKVFKLFYMKIPSYKNLDFSQFDVVITEGIHYPLISYLENFQGKIILNDSITTNYSLDKKRVDYVNKYFKDSIVVVVNDKIPTIYKNNNLKLNTYTIGHAIDTKKIKFKQRTDFNGKLISVGRLVEEKGYQYIIEAVKNLHIKYPSLSLDIYGTGPLEHQLSAHIKSLGLSSSVRLCGFIDNNLLLEKLHEYDAFISHPLEMDYIAEAFHMGNMEAMANGLPVITTDCGGVPYVVKDFALINEQKNTKSIERSISNLIENNELYTNLSTNGRTYIENEFSLNVIVEKWKIILKEGLK